MGIICTHGITKNQNSSNCSLDKFYTIDAKTLPNSHFVYDGERIGYLNGRKLMIFTPENFKKYVEALPNLYVRCFMSETDKKYQENWLNWNSRGIAKEAKEFLEDVEFLKSNNIVKWRI